ncbi:MAG: GH3 auxin-responsive promoter family protein, partial [Bacteroidaceae bacterium]|nr:GH3 auxin-responsive promoter family protein [Bacteroidaceae bacterium]
MSLTKLGRPIFKGRISAIEKYTNGAEEIQRTVLARLLCAAENTEWGRLFGYAQMKNYEDFAQKVPVNTYEELKAYIDRMRQGEENVLWPGAVKWYAKSSGTTNDKSKFIPISQEGLKNIHYAGGKDAVA